MNFASSNNTYTYKHTLYKDRALSTVAIVWFSLGLTQYPDQSSLKEKNTLPLLFHKSTGQSTSKCTVTVLSQSRAEWRKLMCACWWAVHSLHSYSSGSLAYEMVPAIVSESSTSRQSPTGMPTDQPGLDKSPLRLFKGDSRMSQVDN